MIEISRSFCVKSLRACGENRLSKLAIDKYRELLHQFAVNLAKGTYQNAGESTVQPEHVEGVYNTLVIQTN